MQLLPVTAATAACFAILFVLLSAQTSSRRASLKASYGDADDATLRRRIRAHGNFAENAPFALILVGLLEVLGAAHSTVLWLAVAFGVSRVLHAIGMLYMTRPVLKAIGMALQHAGFLFAAIVLLERVWRPT